jgi:tetratricopeptide (TPR) repeat protein
MESTTGTPKAPPRPARGRRPAPVGRATSTSEPAVALAREAAWAGQHARAIEVCSGELAADDAGSGIDAASRIELLGLRAESAIALGRFDAAEADAQAMATLAAARRAPALRAQAGNCLAHVQMRRGELAGALQTATKAVRAARRSRVRALIAQSLLRLGEAQFRTGSSAAAQRSGEQAIALFEADGNAIGAGRAHWVVANARFQRGRAEESRRAADTALALARHAGDWYGIGNALNVRSLTEIGVAEHLRLRQQATRAFATAGNVERRLVPLHNIAIAYRELGLYHHAYRLHGEEAQENPRIGANEAIV